jgi:hypothetical protein
MPEELAFLIALKLAVDVLADSLLMDFAIHDAPLY